MASIQPAQPRPTAISKRANSPHQINNEYRLNSISLTSCYSVHHQSISISRAKSQRTREPGQTRPRPQTDRVIVNKGRIPLLIARKSPLYLMLDDHIQPTSGFFLYKKVYLHFKISTTLPIFKQGGRISIMNADTCKGQRNQDPHHITSDFYFQIPHTPHDHLNYS